MYKVVLYKTAAKKLASLPKNLNERIAKAINFLSLDPHSGKKLSGALEGSLRLRIGDFRIVYDIDEKNKVVVIHAIGSRGDVYK